MSDSTMSVTEAAAALGVSRETVRQMIAAGELYAEQVGSAPRSPFRIDRADVEHRIAINAEKATIRKQYANDPEKLAAVLAQRERHHAKIAEHRERTRGMVVGRGDEFAAKLDETGLRVGSPDGPTLGDHWRELRDRSDLLDRIERDMYSDPAMARRFEELDKDEAEEAEAHELARRIRRAERIRKRAEEILDADDD